MHQYHLIFFAVLLALTSCSTAPHNTRSHKPPVLVADWSKPFYKNYQAKGRKFVVSTQGVATSRSATKMLEQGGNIIDAVVAASFTISVERPHSTGIGGGGFLLYRTATGQTYAVDFRGRAPLKSRRHMFLDRNGTIIPNLSTDGILSADIPGLVAGLIEVHKKFGRLPLSQVLQPAIKLAEEGFTVYPSLAEALKERRDILATFEASRKIFLKADLKPYKAGELLVQTDLAKTLRLIAQNGREGFYSGSVAEAIALESHRLRGRLTSADLKNYQVKWRKPLEGTYGDFSILTMPPPSSGGTHILQILNFIENDHLKNYGAQSQEAIHLTASGMQQAFADRAKYMGDPDFVSVPVDQLISKSYAAKIRKKFNLARAKMADEVSPGQWKDTENVDTTHISIMDDEGHMVSTTQSINGHMGSGLVVPGTGIVLNNEMDDFTPQVGASNLYGAVGGESNLIEPGKTPLSSMAPTLVLDKKQRPVLVIGAPGGTRIISCIAQTILNYLEFGMTLPDAVAAVRFHHQWRPDRLLVDPPGLDTQTMLGLASLGYPVKPKEVHCRVMAVAREAEQLIGVSDPRDFGSAEGR